jgi:hypothetical protein
MSATFHNDPYAALIFDSAAPHWQTCCYALYLDWWRRTDFRDTPPRAR